MTKQMKYIMLLSMNPNGVTQARNVLIPIQIGTQSAAPENRSSQETDETGELIISLPARESP